MSDDSDSSYDDEIFTETVTIHGREYQKFAVDVGGYFTPIDKKEMTRLLESLHRLMKTICLGQIVLPPVRQIHQVLDLGFGAATWAIKMATNFPNATVFGFDVCCHMLPDQTPSNIHIEHGDLNDRLTYQTKFFDLIQARFIADSIDPERWPHLVEEILYMLKPGGWCQMLEFYPMIQSANGSIGDDHALRRWSKRYMHSIDTLKNPRIGVSLRTELEKAGFIDVRVSMIPVPLCAWHENKDYKPIGDQMSMIIEDYLRCFSLLPITAHTQMSIKNFDKLIADAVAEAKDVNLRAYIPLYICVAQRPPQGWISRVKAMAKQKKEPEQDLCEWQWPRDLPKPW